MQKNLPSFANIDLKTIPKTIATICNDNLATINHLVNQPKITWETLLRPIEDLDDNLHNIWETIEHLYMVDNSEELRAVYQECIPIITAYSTQLAHNKKLYQAIKKLYASQEFQKLNKAQKRVIANELRDFKLSGATLTPTKKKQFAKIQQQLALLTTKFSDNVMDATHGWQKLITDKKKLAGLPQNTLALLHQTAKQQKKKGWLLGLDQPTYVAVITYADARALREEIYHAYVTRASTLGPNAKKWDNDPVMRKIMQQRVQLAQLMNFKNYAEFSLATKAAKSTSEVIKFLKQLAKYSQSKARHEYQELRQFAQERYNLSDLQPWDIAYISEKLQTEKFHISQEDLRPYFPLPHVLNGMFKLAHKLFGIIIKTEKNIDSWRKDVQVFAVYDKDKKICSMFYLDLYARSNKQNGAWMHDARSRRILPNNKIQLPIAYITCNFQPPIGKTPALLTHSDVETLFHEFGHALQHMLTKINYAAVSGISGIPWDVVELPSQFMENWCWQKPVINMISKHYKTGKKLPTKLFNNMVAAKNFQSGLQMLRQIELALFDIKLHKKFDVKQRHQIQNTLNSVRRTIAVIPTTDYNRFQNSFLHIFAGGYAAGYYSYKWAELLSADAFAKFECNGLFDPKTGQAFLKYILEPGGSDDAMQLFKRFRGRAPSVKALLKHGGISTKQ